MNRRPTTVEVSPPAGGVRPSKPQPGAEALPSDATTYILGGLMLTALLLMIVIASYAVGWEHGYAEAMGYSQ